jgi:N-methylhydantoinase A/oxoprolinase/acetone carboxylase beta subunit
MVRCDICKTEYKPLSHAGVTRGTVLRCPDCDKKKKLSKAAQRLNTDIQNDLLSMTKRIEKIEYAINMVQTTVEAIVQTKLFDLESQVIEKMDNQIEEQLKARFDEFTEKLQNQMVTISNRVIQLEDKE